MASPQKAQQLNPGPCDGFDEYAGRHWMYPINMPVRGYQKAAVEMALFHNAMIVLPTGFGKTFIAAVVMYNFYNWYPQGKIIFVAPTRPLVAQQISECKKVSGIPSSACIELTGVIPAERRRELVQKRRVIFATPQVIENDLTNGILPAKLVRCIVIDEAHRAQGNYSYVNIVRHLQDNNRNGFRILALSATPGSDMQRVQQVMLNLYINDIMFRTETSIDLMHYRNEKSSRAWTVELTGKHKEIVDKFIKLSDPIFKDLHRAGLTFSADSIDRVAKFTLIKILKGEYNGQPPRVGMTGGKLKFLAAVGTSLQHQFELLTLYGLRVFYANVTKAMLETRSNLKTFLAPKVEFEMIKRDIEVMFGDDIELNPDKKPSKDLLIGHPKLAVTKDLLVKHFTENQEKQETRAIVFTKYRDSVIDIVQSLKTFDPLLKPVAFIGQNATKQGGVGMTQKEQAKVIAEFKMGTYNTIVATCVAEEGLDIGEVDLIIAYDTSGSISTTQRRGRTGRKRSGNVHSILTKGYEEKRLKKAGDDRRQVEDQLYKRENYNSYRYRDAPRMVPTHITPVCFELKVFPVDDEEEASASKTKRKRTTTKRAAAPLAIDKKDTSIKKFCTDGNESGGGGCDSSFKSAGEYMAEDWPESSPDCLWD
jgi:ERCC4-related helicase